MSPSKPFSDPGAQAALLSAARQGSSSLHGLLSNLSVRDAVFAAAEALLPHPDARGAVLPHLGHAIEAAIQRGDERAACRGVLIAARLSLVEGLLHEVPEQLQAVEHFATRTADGYRAGFGRLLRAELALATGHPQQARDRVQAMLQAFDEATHVDQVDALRRYAHGLLVVISATLGDHAGLRQALDALQALDTPDCAMLTYHRALSAAGRGAIDDARAELERVVEHAADPTWAVRASLMLATLGAGPEAIDRAEALATASSQPTLLAEVFFARVRAALQRGAPAEAAALLEQVIEGTQPELLGLRAEVAAATGEPAEAIHHIEALLALAKERELPVYAAEAHLLAARLYPDLSVRAWQLRQAQAIFETLDDAVGLGRVRAERALLQADLGKPDEALADALVTQDLGRRLRRPDLLVMGQMAQARAAGLLGRAEEAALCLSDALAQAEAHHLGALHRACLTALGGQPPAHDPNRAEEAEEAEEAEDADAPR